MTLPLPFLEQIPDGVYVMLGFDRNLWALPRETFDRLVRSASTLNLADPIARSFLRMFLGSAEFLAADGERTLSIPPGLVQAAGLSGGLALIGQGDYFEIWSAGLWEQQRDRFREFQANAQTFSALHIATR